jgi:hypothetical protein
MKKDKFIWNGCVSNTSDVGYGEDFYDPFKEQLKVELTESEEE